MGSQAQRLGQNTNARLTSGGSIGRCSFGGGNRIHPSKEVMWGTAGPEPLEKAATPWALRCGHGLLTQATQIHHASLAAALCNTAAVP